MSEDKIEWLLKELDFEKGSFNKLLSERKKHTAELQVFTAKWKGEILISKADLMKVKAH